MIRINLLGQARPRASRRPVDTGAALPMLFIFAGLGLGLLFLSYMYFSWQSQLTAENNRIKALRAQKTELQSIKQQVDGFEAQQKILQQRVSTIEQLQRDRTGGQELLDMMANTISRTENLWLTSMARKGNSLALEGSSASINSVANFITAMKRSGYFQKVEIKESKQDDKTAGVQTFNFQITADVVPGGQNAPAAQTKTASAPTRPAAPAAPGKKG